MRRTNPRIWFTLLCVLLILLSLGIVGFRTLHHNQLDNDLLVAIRSNDTNAALDALKQGADPNVRGNISSISAPTPSLLEIVMVLIGKSSTPPHSHNQRMATALMLASQHGNEAVVREILQCGGEVNAKRSGRETALVFAVLANKLKVTQLLLAHGADPNAIGLNGKSVLLLACENGATDIIKALVAKGANTNVHEVGGHYALELVAQRDTTDCVAFLLAHGAKH